jgi:hypothetical protein
MDDGRKTPQPAFPWSEAEPNGKVFKLAIHEPKQV